MMKACRELRVSLALLCCVIGLTAAAAPAIQAKSKDSLEAARAALRTLQFNKAIELLGADGSAPAQYLLGLVYLNGVGVPADPARARVLLESAAERGHGAAAYVLAGELARLPDAPAGASRRWLERSAKLGYARADAALQSGRPLLDRESVGAADPALLTAWVIDCARKNDAAELRRLGDASSAVRDEFGRDALSYAAAAGAGEAAAALLELHADVRAADRAGTTALMIAAEQPDTAMLGLLLQHGADPLAVDAEHRTALFYAARTDQAADIAVLQQAGASLDAHDARGYNALDGALAMGADAAAATLRSLGVHANLQPVGPVRQSGEFDPAHPGDIYRNWPPLALAVSRNNAAAVQQLLGAGADPNLRVPQGDPLLQVAADAHAMESLQVLLAHGADAAAAAGHGGHSVLWLAAARNDIAVVKSLLHAGVQPDAHSATEQTALLATLRSAHAEELAAVLLDAGAGPEAADEQGRTPLMIASAAGETALVNLLLAHHARVDAQDHERRSALWYASAAGSRDQVTALLAAGAGLEAADARGLTVLHAAAAQPAAAVLSPLLAAHVHVNARSTGGDTPLLIAAATGHTEVVLALLAHKPDLDAQNTAGDTALIAASRGGYLEICRLLAGAGANKALRNGAGVSAADVAAGRGFASIAKELAGNG
jgi:ankyrin repeat protein